MLRENQAASAPTFAGTDARAAREAAGAAPSPAPQAAELARAPSRRPRVLVVGPLPPPMGGVQLLIDMLIHSSLARDFEIHVVDTSKRVLRWAVETPSWRTPLYYARDLGRLVPALKRLEPEVVLIHASGWFSFVRDWTFMVAARAFGERVVCHYPGTLHPRFPSALTPAGRFFGRVMMGAAHRVIVVGPTYRDRFAEAWRREDVAWSPNVTDVALFRAAAGQRGPWL